MASFDASVWQKRAAARRDAAIAAGKDADRAHAQWEDDVKNTESLRVVVEWCEARSLTVNFCRRGGGIYYTADKQIKVSGRASPRSQVHILLHECGHFLIGTKDRKDRYQKGYAAVDPNVRKSTIHRIDILDEEFEAWHRAWRLGLKLGALRESDREHFDLTRVSMLNSYILWGARAPGYEDSGEPSGEP